MTEEKQQHQRVRFDMTINLGHLISLISFLASLVMVWINFNTRIVLTEQDNKVLREEQSNMKQVITKLQESSSMQSLTMMRLTTIIEMREKEEKGRNKKDDG